MKKKTRNTLTDLLQEVDINNLKEPEIEPKKKAQRSGVCVLIQYYLSNKTLTIKNRISQPFLGTATNCGIKRLGCCRTS